MVSKGSWRPLAPNASIILPVGGDLKKTNMGGSTNGGTPSYHPFLDGIFE